MSYEVRFAEMSAAIAYTRACLRSHEEQLLVHREPYSAGLGHLNRMIPNRSTSSQNFCVKGSVNHFMATGWTLYGLGGSGPRGSNSGYGTTP